MRTVVLVALVACGSSEVPSPAPLTQERHADGWFHSPAHTEFTAVIVPVHTIFVTPSIEARLERLDVGLGDMVHAGELIGQLDDVPLRAQLKAALADEHAVLGDVQAANAELLVATRSLSQEQHLAHAGLTSTMSVNQHAADVETRQGRLSSARGRHAAAVARREELERLLYHATITAPFDGTIMMLGVQAGDLVRKDTRIAQVADPTRLRLRFAVPRDVEVAVGERVEASIRGHDKPIAATVRKYVATQDPPDHFFVVDADIDTRDAELLALASVGHAWFVDR
jgi:multidrug efflux pump subunit AcrA (membrane-fusion protein)